MTDTINQAREALQKADILGGYRINGKPMGLLAMIAWNIRDHGAYGPMASGRESVAQCLEAVETAVEALLSAPSQADAPTDWRALASRLNGLHAQMFGIASMDDPALALKGIQDGGVLHEAVHDCLRALPVSAALSRPAPESSGNLSRWAGTMSEHFPRPAPDVPGAEEEIRARHEAATAGGWCDPDRATLLAKHDALQAALDAARAELAEERAKRGEMTEIAVNNAAKLHAAKAELAEVREAAARARHDQELQETWDAARAAIVKDAPT
jgi:hypothetical protein